MKGYKLKSITWYQVIIIGVLSGIIPAMFKLTSIKSGQKLNSDEQEYIVNHLFSCKEPNLSPDNKQIFITLNKNDIENKFNG